MLRVLLTSYLAELGFKPYTDAHDRVYWYHPSLGGGRTLMQCVEWAMGCEEAGRSLKVEAESFQGIINTWSPTKGVHVPTNA